MYLSEFLPNDATLKFNHVYVYMCVYKEIFIVLKISANEKISVTIIDFI